MCDGKLGCPCYGDRADWTVEDYEREIKRLIESARADLLDCQLDSFIADGEWPAMPVEEPYRNPVEQGGSENESPFRG